MCKGCKDPELQYIHQKCINAYISNLPVPRRPRSPRPSSAQQSLADFLSEEPSVVLYDCTRCRDPYTVETRTISPFITIYKDKWLLGISCMLLFVCTLLIASGVAVCVASWNSTEILFSFFGLHVTVIAGAILLMFVGLGASMALGCAIYATATGRMGIHVVGTPL